VYGAAVPRWTVVGSKFNRSTAVPPPWFQRPAPRRPQCKGSGRTTRGGSSKEEPHRRRADRRRKDARTTRVADEGARKTAAAQQTAVEVMRAGREAHDDALLRAE
jgi:hypothetical protein